MAISVTCYSSSGGVSKLQAFFWTFRKKLKPQKTQNSSKILKKLKQNPEKTQKMANPVELSWRQSERKLHFGGEKLGVPLKTPFLLSNIFKNVKSSTFL